TDEKSNGVASPTSEKPTPSGHAGDAVKVAGILEWSVDENGQTKEMTVPVLEGSGVDLRWLLTQPPSIREPVRRELERRGRKVELQRQLVALNLKDGRSVVMPIDQVEIKFAGRVFQ